VMAMGALDCEQVQAMLDVAHGCEASNGLLSHVP
jgi:hypothetical protein